MATSTPPLSSSPGRVPPPSAERPSSVAMPPPESLVTGARNRITGSPCSVTVSRSWMVEAGVAGRSRRTTPRWASAVPLASRIIAPTTSLVPARVRSVPAESAPSRSWVSSGLSSVSTPYLLL